MNKNQKKVIIISTVSALVGMGLFFRMQYEKMGKIDGITIGAGIFSLIVFGIILFIQMRKMNQ